jgi:glycosyltransferase involved in cell wall biosynthesis
VHHLGLVERADQLQLVAAAHALVSASRFEGGAGASGTLDAALLGTPIVASDIEPHRELGFGRSVFFDVTRSPALAEALVSLGAPAGQVARQPLFNAQQMELLLTASGLQTLAALRAALA